MSAKAMRRILKKEQDHTVRKEENMKFIKASKKLLTYLLVAALLLGCMPAQNVEAASAEAIKKIVIKNGKKTVTKKTIKLAKGKSTTLKVTVSPSKAKKKVTYKTNNKKIATVNSKGKVTAKKEGTAKITVTALGKNGKKKTSYVKVKVTKKESNVAVTAVNATASPSGQISVGGVCTIVASVVPANASNKTLTYTSANPAIAAVNQAGVVTGMSEGTTTIRVAASNGIYKDVPIRVNRVSVTGITLDRSSIELNITGTTTLSATVLPQNATNKKVKWTSGDETVATVKDGVVTGRKAGTTKIYATTEEGNFNAECTVIVKAGAANEVVVLLEVTNEYEGTDGKKHDNTVLVGNDVEVRARVLRGSQPVGNTNVRLAMQSVYGNASGRFVIRNNDLTTDSDGYATFYIGLKDDYANTQPIDRMFQSFKVTATNSSSGKSSVPLSIRFACIQLPDLLVENNLTARHNDIEPAVNATTLVADYAGIEPTYSENGHRVQEYVSTQQVSGEGESHKVYFSCTPYILLPAIEKEGESGEWEHLVNKDSGACSVYNDVTNETTTMIVEKVPAGLQFITARFNKIKLSAYTAIYIDVYAVDSAGVPVFSKVVTNASNTEGKDKDGDVQIEKQKDKECYIVFSLVSQGQVDTSNEGYVLEKLFGHYAGVQSEEPVVEELNNSVTWEDISDDVTYETVEWDYSGAARYFKSNSEFLNRDYKYSYKVPVFPYSGNAIITVKDKNDNVKGYFAYPAVHKERNEDGEYKNVNVLAPPKSEYETWKTNEFRNHSYTPYVRSPYPIQISEEETRRTNATVTTEGNLVKVDTRTTGITSLRATVNINGLDTVLNKMNGGVLYTSVQWDPLPNKVAKEEIPDFYAVEGQEVTVIAQLYDVNNNKAPESNKTVVFSDSIKDEVINTQGKKVGGNGKNDQVTVVNEYRGYTDSQGQVTLKLKGEQVAYIEELAASCDNFNVKLIVGGEEVNKANIYWVDLGLSFVDTADTKRTEDSTEITNSSGKTPVRTTTFNEPLTIAEESVAEVGTVWDIGFLPVARSHTFKFSDLNVGKRPKQANEFVKVKNVPVTYSKTDKMATGESTLTEKNSVATLTSDKIGTTELTGVLGVKVQDTLDLSKVIFEFYDEDMKIVSKKNIGEGIPNFTSTSLMLKENWQPAGMQLELFAANNDNRTVDRNTDTVVYAKVTDTKGNALKGKAVEYTIDGVKKTSLTTNDKGIASINLPAPKGTARDCIVTAKVSDTVEKNITIRYTDTATTAFAIQTENLSKHIREVEVNPNSKTKVKLYFTNPVSERTVDAREFTLVEEGEATNRYQVTSATVTDTNIIELTLDKELSFAKEVSYTITIGSYWDSDNLEYQLIDTFGQKLTGKSTCYFVPAEVASKFGYTEIPQAGTVSENNASNREGAGATETEAIISMD